LEIDMPNTTHPHVHTGPRWLWAIHDRAFPRTEVGAQLRAIGDTLTRRPGFTIGDNQVAVPDTVEWEIKHELTPHGTHALVIRFEWLEDGPAQPPTVSARGLVIGDIDDAPGVTS
jgi:hypothetical protein